MSTTSVTTPITEGTDVYGSDGDKVGSVVAVRPGYVDVEKGFFFPTDYYIPTIPIVSFEDDRVYLNVTKDAALNQGWDSEPMAVDDYATAGTGVGTMATGTATTASVGTADMDYGSDVARSDAGMAAGSANLTTDADMTTGATAETTRVETGDALRVPVREEELTAVKRQRELGGVRVEKDVVAEERVLEVPVTEERVRVERRVVDRPVEAGDATAFEEGVIEVPIRGEEVELQKQARVVEEVEIGKEAVQRTEEVAGTVRREEVRVGEVQNAAETRTVEAQPAQMDTDEVVRRTTVVEETDAGA